MGHNLQTAAPFSIIADPGYGINSSSISMDNALWMMAIYFHLRRSMILTTLPWSADTSMRAESTKSFLLELAWIGVWCARE